MIRHFILSTRTDTKMNEDSYTAAIKLVPATYISQGRDAKKTHEKQIQALIYHRKLPVEGWTDSRIRLLLNDLSLMDSNNFPENVGVGEREARIYSNLVRERHFGLGHGIGRSGDVAAVQPKAAGSSLLNQLTNSLLLDLLKQAGVYSTQSCVLIPVATGMALTLVFLSLRLSRPSARYIIWPRIDQMSCFKSILSAGFEPIVVENVLEGNELRTDIKGIERAITDIGPDHILCIMTTTSCFAPRAADKLSEVAILCSKHDLPHIVNNAYGVQSTKCMHLIQEATHVGRVDAFVQSTDKNLLVPVGGAIVASCRADFVKKVSQTYPGRASSTPSVDVFITLLSLGSTGYKKLCTERKENYQHLLERLSRVAECHNEQVLVTRNNPISIAISLTSLPGTIDWTQLGSMLFLRNVSGTRLAQVYTRQCIGYRVVAPGCTKTIGSYTFTNWGSHSNEYPCTYLTAAAAIGMTCDEINTFCERLDKTLTKFKKKFSTKVSIDESGAPQTCTTENGTETQTI